MVGSGRAETRTIRKGRSIVQASLAHDYLNHNVSYRCVRLNLFFTDDGRGALTCALPDLQFHIAIMAFLFAWDLAPPARAAGSSLMGYACRVRGRAAPTNSGDRHYLRMGPVIHCRIRPEGK